MTKNSDAPRLTARKALALPALSLLALALSPALARAQWTQPTPPDTNIHNTNSGNVGIGTGATAPSERLVTIGNILGGNVTSRTKLYSTYDSQTPAIFELGYGTATSSVTPFASFVLSKNATSAENLIGGLSFANSAIADGSDKRLAAILGWSGSTTTSGNLRFYTMSGGTFSERMRLDSSGNLGLGTTSPGNLLHVEGGSSYGQMRVSGTGLAALNLRDNAGPADAKFYQLRTDAGLFRLSLLNDAENTFVRQNILAANSSGDVGVGTASPSRRLEVSMTTTGGHQGMALTNTNGRSWWLASADAAGNGSAVNGAPGNGFAIIDWTAGRTRLAIDGAGNVGIGAQSPTHTLEVAGTINASQGITGATINVTYQDVAEWVPSTQKLEAGTVVVLDTERANHVPASTESYDTKVAGVVSARPGISLGESGEGKALVATTGRVRVKVDATRAPIKVGDLLVTSDVEGVAMRSEPIEVGGRKMHAPGTIIGKALEPLEKGTGEILVLLSLQ
jgi:hypothetical protein